MFTGIIEEIGTVKEVRHGHRSAVVTISAEKVLPDTSRGDSIAVNGVCLTVIAMDDDSFSADATPETISRSSLGQMHRGSRVNLERAMAADGRFGGHIVMGHIDGIGKVSRVIKDDNSILLSIEAPPALMRYIVEKGSIAIDGISLTVAEVWESGFTVSVIPHTASETTIGWMVAGTTVNLETDIIGKYAERFLMPEKRSRKGITAEMLSEYGF